MQNFSSLCTKSIYPSTKTWTRPQTVDGRGRGRAVDGRVEAAGPSVGNGRFSTGRATKATSSTSGFVTLLEASHIHILS